MIWGIGEFFCTPEGAQVGAQCADLGAQREQITALSFVPFWYPYFKSSLGIARLGAGAGTGADTGADTKVKICFPRKLPPAKRGQISV